MSVDDADVIWEHMKKQAQADLPDVGPIERFNQRHDALMTRAKELVGRCVRCFGTMHTPDRCSRCGHCMGCEGGESCAA
jgi:hypothetical protein